MRVISLFSGIGGIDLAFQWAGFKIAAQVEIDPYCQQVLQKHWPRVQRFGDIRHVRGTDLPAANVMAGGFPCQDISTAGKGTGIKKGTRSGLWFEFARLIGEFRPRVVFLENVPAIATNGGYVVLNSLAALGYDAEWGIMAAAEVGAPHKRERWFCVAYPGEFNRGRDNGHEQGRQSVGERCPDVEHPASIKSNMATRSEREYLPDASLAGQVMGYSNGERCEEQQFAVQGKARTEGVGLYGGWNAQSSMGRILDGLSTRLDRHRWPARPGEEQHDWEAPRTVHKGEVAHRAPRLKALGNAVVPQVVYPFAVAIREWLISAR